MYSYIRETYSEHGKEVICAEDFKEGGGVVGVRALFDLAYYCITD